MGWGICLASVRHLSDLALIILFPPIRRICLQADAIDSSWGWFLRDAMERLPVETIKEFVATGKPLLGICLGMQLLFEESEENGPNERVRIITWKCSPLSRENADG